jgi:hypothetical protein
MLIGVTCINGDIASPRALLPQIVGFVGIHVDKGETIKRRRHLERTGRASLDDTLALFREMNAGAAEAIDIIALEHAAFAGKGVCVGRCILLNDLELDFRPRPDFIGCERTVDHSEAWTSRAARDRARFGN